MTPEHPRDLLAAYCEITGFTLMLSETRKHTLSECWERGIRAEDVRNVCRELKKLVDRGQKGYTDQSLAFRNVFVPDTLEERVAVMKQRKARLQPPKAQQQAVRDTGQGKIFVLDDPPPKDVPPIDLKSSLINLANNIKSA